MLDILEDLYEKRCEREGEPADLESAIAFSSQAVALTPTPDPTKPQRLHRLGTYHHKHFERLDDIQDLSAAITCFSEALPLISNQDERGRLTCLNNLGALLGTRFEYTGQISDLETASIYHSHVLSAAPDEDPDKPTVLHGLGKLHNRKFKRLGSLIDIDTAVSYHIKAVSMAPAKHPARALFLKNLGNSYRDRFQYL
ncbi:hypothetical protein FRC07_004053, partial [Ceratobasidium sp. 392]